jgi:RNA polymerase sigma factor (sigma-70 family)
MVTTSAQRPAASSPRTARPTVRRNANDVVGLVNAAVKGEEQAWADLITRYQPLVASIARRHRLSPADAADVSQTVWLKLLDHLHDLREPRALPGWISTVAVNACLDVIASQRRAVPIDPQVLGRGDEEAAGGAGHSTGDQDLDEAFVRHECRQAIQRGLAELTQAQRTLLLHLVAEPPLPYEEISRRLGIPVGSIGPSRARSLRKLGNTEAVRRLLATGSSVEALDAAA